MSGDQSFQRRGGRVRGAEGYHTEDIWALLLCVKNVVPTTAEEWNQVLDEYRKTHAVPNTRAQRDTNSLKAKFKQLAREFRPEESSRWDVQEAGAVWQLIQSKMVAGQCLQRRGGRARGAEGFSAADAQSILKIIRKFLPVSMHEWNLVADEYCRDYAVPNNRLSRDGLSLKRKFRNWLKTDVDDTVRAEVSVALAVQAEIDAKMAKVMRTTPSKELETEKVVETTTEDGDMEETRSGDGTDAVVNAEAEVGREGSSTTSSEGGDRTSAVDSRRGGRIVGSEGYSVSDRRALLSFVREVLPSDSTGWEQVLQLYRTKHAGLNNRAARNLTGVKSKFRQLVNWRHKTDVWTKEHEDILEARAIQKEIDLRSNLGKRQRSDGASSIPSSRTPEKNIPEDGGENPVVSSSTESSDNPMSMRQHAVAGCPRTEQVPDSARVDKRSIDGVVEDNVAKSARSDIASRELDLLKQRERREAEQAAWDKERSMREKQRIYMESWTVVCDRLRALYRERATEDNLEIISEFDDEIAVLKKKKQRLTSLMI
uniref:Uncharacterized protein n=1 Tax=Hyaloperonospora arabidopsidis (strain Emoy2) TaxID=559515 RepID=M4B903_HYAAE